VKTVSRFRQPEVGQPVSAKAGIESKVPASSRDSAVWIEDMSGSIWLKEYVFRFGLAIINFMELMMVKR
jgi:hypothetical protein